MLELAGVLEPAELQGQQLALGDLGEHPDQLLLHQLVAGDRLAGELDALLGVLEGGLVAVHGRAEAAPGDAVARLVEAHQGVLDADRLGQQVGGRDAAVLEAELGGDRGAQRELAVLIAGGEARRALLDEEAADAVVGLRPDHGDVGDRAVGDPLLGAVEDPAVAVAAGGGAHAARVRAEVGLGEAEAADRLARRQGREPAVALLLRAEGVDRVHHQAALHRDEAAQPGVAALELLHDQAVGDVVQAGQVVLVDGGAEQVELGHLGHQLDRETAVAVALFDDRFEPLVDPGAHGVAHQALLFAQKIVDMQKIESRENGSRCNLRFGLE